MRHPARVKLWGRQPTLRLPWPAPKSFSSATTRTLRHGGECACRGHVLGLAPMVWTIPPRRRSFVTVKRVSSRGRSRRRVQYCRSCSLCGSPRKGLAKRHPAIAETSNTGYSARDLMILWLAMLDEAARVCDFASAIGSTPAEWFRPGNVWPARPGHLRLLRRLVPARRRERLLSDERLRGRGPFLLSSEKSTRLNGAAASSDRQNFHALVKEIHPSANPAIDDQPEMVLPAHCMSAPQKIAVRKAALQAG